ncbi:TonB-dependent siderophore receptor [Phaeobacter sp.]|uniref:TonB-dependent siderophore receptor n=1 Tax=Phaeobacter sp. TaxID=1902409 RepID=UPI0025EFF27C|nr:TonB-dependent siderophore receptor [Phaeobacter sp.]
MPIKQKHLRPSYLAIILATTAPAALAQTADNPVILRKIVISNTSDPALKSVETYAAEAASTATRGLEGDLATTPRSVSVVSERQITDQAAGSVEDAIAYLPGVTVQTFGLDNRYDQYAIRGFDAQNAGIYRDGMPLRLFGWGAWRTETFGLERIEVLRGPTGSLYGANQPGGLVNAITKRPDFETGTELTTRVTEHGGAEVGIDTKGVFSDTLAYRFVGLTGETGTIFDEVDESRIYLAPSLTWSPTDRTNLTVFAQYQKDDVGDTYILAPQYGTQLPNPVLSYGNDFYTNNPNRNTIQTTQSYVGYEFDHTFDNGLTFRSRARYADNDWLNQTAYAGAFYSSAVLAGLPPVPNGIDTATLVDFDVDQRTKQISFDNALSTDVNFGAVTGTVMAGIDHYSADYDNTYAFGYGGTFFLQTGQITLLPGVPTTPAVTVESQDIKQTGLYVIGNLNVGDNLVVDAGLRHDRLDIDGSQNGVRQTNDQSFTSGHLGLSYALNEEITVYGNVAKSFALPPSGFSVTGQPLDVEESQSFELGARFRPLGTNSLLSIAVFDIRKTNTAQSVAGIPGAFEQVGEVRSRGVELEANYNFENGLSVLAGYTYIDGEITKDSANQGNALARIPEHAASLWLNYEVAQVPGLRAGIGARYTGARFSDSANTPAFELDDVTVFDASVTYSKNDWTATLAASNLTNESYVTYCNPASVSALPSPALAPQGAGCAFGAGRTVSFTLSRQF